MRSPLFTLFDISAPSYFILLLTGFAFATAVAVLQARRIGENPDVIVDLSLAALLMGVVGARIFHVLFDGFFWDYVHMCTDPSLVDIPFAKTQTLCESERVGGVWDAVGERCHAQQNCLRWAEFWTGGLTYYGGLIFASIAGVRLLRKDRFPVLKACDLSAIGIAMGLGFGRVGCLLAGCCFGKHAETPFSLVFPPRSPAVDAQQKLGLLDHIGLESLPVYPTQPMESLMSFGVAGFLLFYLHPRKRYDGQIFVWFLALYAAGRFLLEFLRADDRGEAWGLSTSQIIGVILIAGAVGLHRHILRRQGEPVPA